MKKFQAVTVLLAIVLLGFSCTTQMKPRPGEASAPSSPSSSSAASVSSVPSTAPGDVETITGTVGRMHLVKGWGFSHVDLAVEITTEDGLKAEFFARDNSILIMPDGQEKPVKKVAPKLFKGKQVEIKYSVITDATGGLQKYENGKNGIVSMRVLN